MGVRKVRTQAGVKRYGAPIGTPIVADPVTGKFKAVTKGVARLDSAKGGRAGGSKDAPRMKTPSNKPVGKKPKPGKPTAKQSVGEAAKNARVRLNTHEHRAKVSETKDRYRAEVTRSQIINGPGPWDPDDDFEKRGEWVDGIMEALVEQGKSTDKMHKEFTYGPNGEANFTYTPERRKLQNQLLDEMWKRSNADGVPRERKALFTGGAGGSGKGQVLKTAGIKENEDYVTVNADDFKELMAEKNLIPVPDGISQMEGVSLVHEESSDLATMFAERLQREGVNMTWDITMSGASQVLKRIHKLRMNGYEEIRGMYVDVPLEVSIAGAKKRYANGMRRLAEKGGDIKGGRRVPPAVIAKSASEIPGVTKNKLAFEEVRKEFTVAERWDNNRFDPETGRRLPPAIVD